VTDAERRQAVALAASDALRWTHPMTRPAQDAIRAAVHRLIYSEPITDQEEHDLTRLMLERGCDLTPPYQGSTYGG
jgi:hypothetical protein